MQPFGAPAQVAYVPKVWSSVPYIVWVPNINWIVFFLVFSIQTGVTIAVFLTRATLEGTHSSCRGFCGSWIHLDAKAHTHTGLALFLLIAFRANSR